MVVSETLSVLQNYFLNPLGLIALSGLIPLLIFYLIKKKPEEEVMPSMMFFTEDKKSGKVKNAFKTLLRNLFLLLHIFIVIGFAAALAHPFFQTEKTPEKAVVVLDRSASMNENFEQTKQFLNSNLGEQNTLILVGDEVDVPVEQGSAGAIEQEIDSVEPSDTGTDIAGALKRARQFEGNLIIGTDMDQTVNSESPEKILNQIRNSGRKVKTSGTEMENSWGIIGIKPGKKSSEIEIKNFREEKVSPEIDINGEKEKIDIPAGSVISTDAEMEEGRNRVTLENDEFKTDNEAFISVPSSEEYSVVYISENQNQYLEKAFQLINFTDIRTVEPPISSELDADIYITGDSDKLLSENIKTIEEDVREGSGLVVFSHEKVFSQGFDSLPVESTGEVSEKTVSIQKPVRTTLKTEVMDVSKKRGEELTSGSNGLIKADHGDGEILFYNIGDKDFRQKFVYPVFWKRITREMMDKPAIEQLNKRTGGEIEAETVKTPDGTSESERVKLEQTGFYNTSKATYSSNLLNEDESSPEPSTTSSIGSSSDTTSNKDIQNLLALMLALIITGEAAYLRRLGEV